MSSIYGSFSCIRYKLPATLFFMAYDITKTDLFFDNFPQKWTVNLLFKKVTNFKIPAPPFQVDVRSVWSSTVHCIFLWLIFEKYSRFHHSFFVEIVLLSFISLLLSAVLRFFIAVKYKIFISYINTVA